MSGQPRRSRAHIRALGDTAVEMLLASPTLNVVGAAAEVGVTESSVYSAWRRRFPDRPPRGRGITPQMQKVAAEPFAALCDVVLVHVPSGEPVSAREIFAAVCQGDGVGERRLWRALRRLIDTQQVERVGEIYTTESMYRRSATTMTKKIDREQLKRTAMAASQDEWQWQDDGDALEGVHDGQIVLYADEDEDSDGPVLIASAADREHIAAASPPVVLALIARIEELEAGMVALLGSASPVPVMHPAMSAAWEAARTLFAKGTVLS